LVIGLVVTYIVTLSRVDGTCFEREKRTRGKVRNIKGIEEYEGSCRKESAEENNLKDLIINKTRSTSDVQMKNEQGSDSI
jgi:hypothetical protein